jgi:hypothetical protein
MIVLFHPDPATNRNSAILVVQFSDGTATQEFTGGLAVFAFFPDRIAFSATTWEVPWPVCVHNRPLDTQASRPMQACHSGTQERDPEHLSKKSILETQFFFTKKYLFRNYKADDRLVSP